MIAFDATARSTSDSLMPPIAVDSTLTLTSSLGILRSASVIASALPCTSALTMMLSDFCSPCPMLRSEEHTSELQSLMRISYAVFCLKKKTVNHYYIHYHE